MKGENTTGKPGGFYVTIATAAGSTTKKVDGDMLTVGRADDCHLTISHETLSRRHLTISTKDGFCWIEDHGSSNGTFVNGKRVKPHVMTRVQPEDQVTMGQAGVRLSVSIEALMRKEGAPPVPRQEERGAVSDTIVTSTSTHRRELRRSVVTPLARPADDAQQQAERVVQEAQKKAAVLLQEAEVEAERRVEEIYRRAHETQAKMDEVYQRRMNEAYLASEQIYQKSQEESVRILDVARQKAGDIRQQTENFVTDLRKRTEEDCERMLEEAQQTARDLKEQRLVEAEDISKKKEEELVAKTRVVMDERLARFDEDLMKEAAHQRQELRIELEERRTGVENELKDKLESIKTLKAQAQQLTAARQQEDARLTEVEALLKGKTEESKRLLDQVEAASKAAEQGQQELLNLRADIEKMKNEREITDKQVKTSQDALTKLNDEIRAANNRVKDAQDDAANELLQLRAKLEDDKAKIGKEEIAHMEELKLQTTRKIREMELSLVDELHDKKDLMSRELALTVETYLKEDPSAKAKNLKPLQDEMRSLLEKQIVTITKDDSAKAKQASLIELKRRQKWMTGMTGAMVGMAMALIGEHAYFFLKNEQSPVQRQVAALQEQRKADLESRRFNPPQTSDFKATYVDNVVYTENFTGTYTSDDFQKKFLKGLVPYMLKTWKTDESKVIELMGISVTLVKTLADKRANIHPDFVNQGLEKMKQDETEAMNRMRTLLGSQVRLESFKKFEKQFFERHSQGGTAATE
ncbi:MAG: FHA domain-containing protein [Bdellovibrionales bacterium]|nr:FHA domain-containing protein [Bdellovibrionales bacterium]